MGVTTLQAAQHKLAMRREMTRRMIRDIKGGVQDDTELWSEAFDTDDFNHEGYYALVDALESGLLTTEEIAAFLYAAIGGRPE